MYSINEQWFVRFKPIPLYTSTPMNLKKHVIKNKKRFIQLVQRKSSGNQVTSLVLSSEWYEKHKSFVQEKVIKHKNLWTFCEFWRDVPDLGIVAVVGLKPNKIPSRRINKRVVNRAFTQQDLVQCIFSGRILNRRTASAEHIIPSSKGGNNSVWNLCLSHVQNNNHRGNKDFWTFYSQCRRKKY